MFDFKLEMKSLEKKTIGNFLRVKFFFGKKRQGKKDSFFLTVFRLEKSKTFTPLFLRGETKITIVY